MITVNLHGYYKIKKRSFWNSYQLFEYYSVQHKRADEIENIFTPQNPVEEIENLLAIKYILVSHRQLDKVKQVLQRWFGLCFYLYLENFPTNSAGCNRSTSGSGLGFFSKRLQLFTSFIESRILFTKFTFDEHYIKLYSLYCRKVELHRMEWHLFLPQRRNS